MPAAWGLNISCWNLTSWRCLNSSPSPAVLLLQLALFEELLDLAAERGLRYVIDGSNKDDEGDYRPGREALKELGIRSPFMGGRPDQG